MFDAFKDLWKKRQPDPPGSLADPQAELANPSVTEPSLEAGFALIRTPESQLLETWESHRGRAGHLPVLLGTRDDLLEEAINLQMSAEAVQEILQKSREIDLDQWMKANREKRAQTLATYGQSLPELDWSTTDDIPLPLPEPFANVSDDVEVILALLPVERPWQAAARVNYGGWNDCPPADVLTAFFKRWHERYGAVPISLAYDSIEFHIANPPTTDEACKALAMEQLACCPNRLDTGLQTMGNFAKSLKGASWWYLGWD